MEKNHIPYHAVTYLGKGPVVVLAPHPDDEILGCGGTIIRHVAAGDSIAVVIVTDGGFLENPLDDKDAYIHQRKQESIHAAHLLGYGKPIFWGLPDRGLSCNEVLVNRIIDVIQKNKARLVYAPSIYEIHPDHRALGTAAIEAIRDMDSQVTLVMYEVGVPLRPNCLLDISDIFSKKLHAVRCFASQLAKQAYDRHIEALNRFRTYTLPRHIEAAEAYLKLNRQQLGVILSTTEQQESLMVMKETEGELDGTINVNDNFIPSVQGYIPKQVAQLPEGPWLIFAAHPRDASLGMGGTLLLGAKHGIKSTLVILTDEGQFTVPNNGPTRQQIEVHAASIHLGITDTQFWGQQPGNLRVTDTLVKRVVSLVCITQAKSVFFCSPLCAYPDQQVTAAVVWEGIKRCAGFRGTVYAYEVSTQCPVNRLIDITAVAAEKAAVMAVHSSHVDSNRDADVVDALNRSRAYTLPSEVNSAEAFFAFDRIAKSLEDQFISWLKPCWRLQAVPVQEPLVSVMIRTRDRPNSLPIALESVIRQSYGNLEMVVVNDGGQDVAETIQQFTERTALPLRYRNLQPGRGRSAAANACLQEATGDYLIFLDDDDWFEPQHIRNLIYRLEKEPGAIAAYSGVRCLRLDSEGKYQLVKIYNENFEPTKLIVENYIPIHALMFRRAAIIQEPLCFFDERLEMFEDWDFWLQLLRHGPFVHDGRITANYFFHERGHDFWVNQVQSQKSMELIIDKWRSQWSVQQIKEVFLGIRNQGQQLQLLAQERSSMLNQLKELKTRVWQMEQLLFSGALQRAWALQSLEAIEQSTSDSAE